MFSVLDELSPLVSKYEVEKSAREEAIVAKSVTEQKSKDFISKQQELIEQLSRDKVCLCVLVVYCLIKSSLLGKGSEPSVRVAETGGIIETQIEPH